jgi:hypothetical protein
MRCIVLSLVAAACITALAERGGRYLVISTPAYLEEVRPLAEWKTRKGVLAKVVSTTETGNSPASIRSYIVAACDSWDFPPEYVVIAGSPNQVPARNSVYDTYYGNVGGDWRMELPVGRLWARTESECEAMVAKILSYEKADDLTDTTWYLKGTTIVDEDFPPDPFYQEDSRIARNYWIAQGYVRAESLSDIGGHNSTHVNAAAADGRMFLTYRGQCTARWKRPFNQVTPNSWHNGPRLPIAVSATCETVTLAPYETMYGDQFVRAGSADSLGGAIAFFGTTRSASRISGQRSACYRGFFKAIFEEDNWVLGQATMRARHRVDSLYRDSVRYLEWNLLGDPELNVWTGVPQELQVVHDTIAWAGSTHVFVVSVLSGGSPVQGAGVCLSMDSTVFNFGLTNASGRVVLPAAPVHAGSLWVVASKHDFRPYEGLCLVPVLRPDIAVSSILSPAGAYALWDSVVPAAFWRNHGVTSSGFEAWALLESQGGVRLYAEKVEIRGLEPGDSVLVDSFPAFELAFMGEWTVKCSTGCELDTVVSNDTALSGFSVVRSDAGADAILAPVGTIELGQAVLPLARVHNYGGAVFRCQTWFSIADPAGSPVYRDSLAVDGLAPAQDTVVSFSLWPGATQAGRYTARCSVYTAGDEQPGNDVKTQGFGVRMWPAGWLEVASMPLSPSGKPVKRGGWLTFSPGTDLVFAQKGYKTHDFYSYGPQADVWTPLNGMPFQSHPLWSGKPPRKGSKACSDGADVIYVTQGNNTLGFWSYHISQDSWAMLPDVPLGPSRKKVKGGTDLAYVSGDPDYVYLLKGYKSEFLRFDVRAGTWEALDDAPAGARAKWDKGSWLVFDEDQALYAHKAKYNELWAYDLGTGLWSPGHLAGMPMVGMMGRRKKSKDGGSACLYQGDLYALKGGNTQEFWVYDPGTNAWAELDTIPAFGSTGRKKRVKYGGDIVSYGDGAFFALKGNRTVETWRYVLGTAAGTGKVRGSGVSGAGVGQEKPEGPSIRPSVARGEAVTLHLSLPASVSGPVSVTLYDAAGRQAVRSVLQVRAGRAALDAGSLSPGVYLVRFDAGRWSESRKLVIQD